MKKILAVLLMVLSIGALVGCVSTHPSASNTESNINSTTTETPISSTDVPGSTTETPGTTTEAPSTTTEVPSTTTETPGTTTEAPGTTTETPGTTTEIEENDVFDMNAYMEGFNERKEYLIEYINRTKSVADGKVGFGICAVQMLMYERTKDEYWLNLALSNAEKCIDQSWKAQSSCFPPANYMAFWCLFKDYFSDSLRDKFINVIKNNEAYSYSSATQNHTLYCAVGRYLAEQEFPGEIVHNYLGYMNSDPTDPTGEKAIRQVLQRYPIYGVYEYNSDTYFGCHVLPLMCLYFGAKDEEIKELALMNIENAIFSMAPVYLDGHICIPAGRTYMPYASQNYNGQANILLWLYFGGDHEKPTVADLVYDEATSLAYMLYSDFVPNWISVAMATDRSGTYNHKELHYYPNGNSFAYLQSEMHEKYSIFSGSLKWPSASYYSSYGDCSLGQEKRFGGYKHRLNWGIRYVSDDPDYWSTFSIQNLHTIDTSRDTPFGSSMYEQIFQYGDTVIGVFDVPEDYNYPNIVLYEPANYVAILDEAYLGRLYIHYGSVIIAFELSQSFVNEIEETDYGDKVRCGKVTKGWFVCEAFDPAEIEGDDPEEQLLYVQSMCYGPFKNVKHDYSDRTWVEYTDTKGNTLSMRWGGESQNSEEKLNGEDVSIKFTSYLTYPIQENPWVTQKWNENVITYSYKGYSYTLDFQNRKCIYSEPTK